MGVVLNIRSFPLSRIVLSAISYYFKNTYIILIFVIYLKPFRRKQCLNSFIPKDKWYKLSVFHNVGFHIDVV